MNSEVEGEAGPILCEMDIRKEDIVITRRMTIGLIPAAAEALNRIKDRHGYKSVDIINRALVVYDLIDEAVTASKAVLFEDDNGHLERIRIVG